MNICKAIIAACAALSFSAISVAAADAEASAAEKQPVYLLTGASFAVPENGWFEIACKEMGVTPLNKSVSGESIINTARKMEKGTFYTTAELDDVELFVINHVHNKDVANTQWLKDSWEDYTNIATTSDYSVAYDYVIKRYIADCKALETNPESRWYGVAGGKPALIMLTTHWHDARTTYNAAIRKLAERWGFPLVKFDENIDFSRLDVASGEAQPSLAVAHDTETIGGVKYGWHPLRGNNCFIQRRMAQIFEQTVAEYNGRSVAFDYEITPASPLVLPGETARALVSFRGGHYPCDFSQAAANALNYTAVNVSGTGVKSSPYFVEQPDASADVLFSVGGVTDAKGTEAASGSSLSTVCLATKSIPATYENFVHQAQQSEQHNTAELLELKNGDGWTRRIYLSFPLADVPENATRIGVRMHFESFVAASLGSEKRYFNAIDTLELSGNTEKYTDKLTWDNHHSHKFEPVAKAILTQDMAGSWIGWDVTDFVKAKAAEGKEQVTFRVTTPLEWRTLTRFSSSRNTANPGYGPVMLLTTAIPAGIETVETDSDPATDPADTSASTSASAEYYTLQGTRIFGTPHGLVIRRIGSRVEKLLIK